MEWRRVDGKVPNAQRTCRHCNRVIRNGQIMLVQRMPTAPLGARELRFHATCIKALTDSCPPDADEEAFYALRDRIAATGLAFPD